MTPRTASEAAWSLHLANIEARAEIKRIKKTMLAVIGHCVYCGGPAIGPVCHAHSDLLALDGQGPEVGA